MTFITCSKLLLNNLFCVFEKSLRNNAAKKFSFCLAWASDVLKLLGQGNCFILVLKAFNCSYGEDLTVRSNSHSHIFFKYIFRKLCRRLSVRCQ